MDMTSKDQQVSEVVTTQTCETVMLTKLSEAITHHIQDVFNFQGCTVDEFSPSTSPRYIRVSLDKDIMSFKLELLRRTYDYYHLTAVRGYRIAECQMQIWKNEKDGRQIELFFELRQSITNHENGTKREGKGDNMWRIAHVSHNFNKDIPKEVTVIINDFLDRFSLGSMKEKFSVEVVKVTKTKSYVVRNFNKRIRLFSLLDFFSSRTSVKDVECGISNSGDGLFVSFSREEEQGPKRKIEVEGEKVDNGERPKKKNKK